MNYYCESLSMALHYGNNLLVQNSLGLHFHIATFTQQGEWYQNFKIRPSVFREI